MNKVYSVIFLSLLIILGSFYSSIVHAVNSSDYYIKYSLEMSIYNPSMNMKYELKALLTTKLSLLENNTVKYTVFIERIESKEIRGNQTSTSTTTPLNENDSNFTINIHYDYEQLYETGFSNGGVLYPILGANLYNIALFTKFYNMSYQGIEKYKDVPVHVFKYKLEYTMPYIIYNLTISSKGEYYIDTVFLQPLYYRSESVLSNGNINITLSLLLETIETNLPQNGVYGYEKTENIELLAGGLPNANILVNGNKGSSMINITNKGTEPGYLVIMYKSNAKTLATTPIIPQEKYRVIYLAPADTKNIDLGIILDNDISLKTSTISIVSNNVNWLEIGGLAVIAVVIVSITYAYYKKKSNINTENVEEHLREETSVNENNTAH
ncbi:MAG: hypothetical protein DRO16_03355 [Thermoprotei archaeon]|nr:MAG: hypothetical protein DRO16_03355 [Thermoprotei archaeon]